MYGFLEFNLLDASGLLISLRKILIAHIAEHPMDGLPSQSGSAFASMVSSSSGSSTLGRFSCHAW
ncbi:hypothetical protein, partial [Ralstonia pseudosolanacearum]|uniref:hypothetical protein n=1 Tax=Ralstonia pseudosolanacearum TaxID=1310165 RepID=UPI003CFFD244